MFKMLNFSTALAQDVRKQWEDEAANLRFGCGKPINKEKVPYFSQIVICICMLNILKNCAFLFLVFMQIKAH